MIKMIIADDNKDLGMTLLNNLSVADEVKVVKYIPNGDEVIQEIKEFNPELILLDLNMPGKNRLGDYR